MRFPKIKLPKIKLPKISFRRPKLKLGRKFWLGKKFLIGVCVSVVIAVGGVLVANGMQRPNIYAIAMNSVAEARFFMKYAHADAICVQFYAGRREEPFNRDGIANRNVDFAIINVEGSPEMRELGQIEGTIRIANEQYSFVLLQSPYNPTHFTNDIIRSLRVPVTSGDEIEITLLVGANNHPTFRLGNAFEEGAISWEQALRAATTKIGPKVRDQRFEVYISIMHNVADSGAFWYIQFVTEDGQTHFTVVAPDGSVIG